MIDLNFVTKRIARLSASIGDYIKAKSDEERVISEAISTLLEEGSFWAAPGEVDLIDQHNYALDVGEIELGRWDQSQNMFMIEGENRYLELNEIKKIYQ